MQATEYKLKPSDIDEMTPAQLELYGRHIEEEKSVSRREVIAHVKRFRDKQAAIAKAGWLKGEW